jgi:uncharacterized protein (TIGR02246 family)
MSPDEKAIRQLVADWMAASLANDIDKLGTMLAEDVIFFRAGQPPMKGRETFLKLARENKNKMRVHGKAETQEVQVAGDVAYMWNRLSITITPHDGGAPITRTGETLSVLRKQPGGRWVLARDANLLSP